MGRCGQNVIVISFFLGSLVAEAQSSQKASVTADPLSKYTVCTITINSDDEAKFFKSKLPKDKFEFMELVPSRGGKSSKSSKHWFKDACTRLKKEKKSCDLLIVSGHFGGAFFGSSGKRLSLETLEEMGCNNSCPGIMQSPKEVFLFGCNTLSGKEKDNRSPEEYRRILREERNAAGERIFTESQVEEIVAFRYSDFGHGNRDRMSRAFSSVPHIYGFDSVAPSGKNVQPSLKKYLKAIREEHKDYAKYLEAIEVGRALKLTTDTQQVVKDYYSKGKKPPASNPVIEKAFSVTNFAQCQGSPSEDSAEFCSLFDEKIPLHRRLSSLRFLLTGPEGGKYLALARQFFKRYPPKKYGKAAKEELEAIRTNEQVRERYQALLKNLEDMPVLSLQLVDLGEDLKLMTEAEAHQRKEKILVGLINAGTLEAKDLVCSREEWPQVENLEFNMAAYQNKYSLEAMTCMSPVAQSLSQKGLRRSLKSKNPEVQKYGAWLIGMQENPSKITDDTVLDLIKILKNSKIKAERENTRRMSAWALHRGLQRGEPRDPTLLKELIPYLKDEDKYVRRDMVFALANAKPTDIAALQALKKSQEDEDETVRELAVYALSKLKKPRIKKLAPISRPAQRGDVNKACEEMDQFKSKVGTSCTSSKGVVFTRIKHPVTQVLGWYDQKTQKIWYDEVKTGVNQYGAEVYCDQKPGQTLASRDDFKRAERHGIREVLKNIQNQWVWSSSSDQYGPDDAFYFDGGFVYNYYRVSRYDNSVTACVGR